MEDVDSAPGGRPAGAGNRRPTGLLGRRRRQPGTDRLRVREVGLDHPDAAAAWSRLSDEGAPTTPFETWQWGSALADVPTLAAAAGVLLAEAGPVGRPGALGLLPIDRRRGPAGPRVLRALGADWLAPDHLDVIAAPQNRAAVARAVTRFLCQRSAGWDLLDLEGLREDGALATALGALGPPGFLALPAEEVRAPYVRLWPDPASGWSGTCGSKSPAGCGRRTARAAGSRWWTTRTPWSPCSRS